MARYVDAFVLPVPKRKLGAYKRLSKFAGRLWKKHGALEYCECVQEDTKVPCGVPFPRIARSKPGEVVFFSWIAYRSRAHRDRVNAKVMSDPEMAKMGDPKDMPFDLKRMAWGGFEALVDM